MSAFPNEDLSDLFSADAFDLATLGFMDQGLEEEAMTAPEDDSPRLSPAHDMDSLEFFLWMNEEVDKEQARRQAAKKQKKP